MKPCAWKDDTTYVNKHTAGRPDWICDECRASMPTLNGPKG